MLHATKNACQYILLLKELFYDLNINLDIQQYFFSNFFFKRLYLIPAIVSERNWYSQGVFANNFNYRKCIIYDKTKVGYKCSFICLNEIKVEAIDDYLLVYSDLLIDTNTSPGYNLGQQIERNHFSKIYNHVCVNEVLEFMEGSNSTRAAEYFFDSNVPIDYKYQVLKYTCSRYCEDNNVWCGKINDKIANIFNLYHFHPQMNIIIRYCNCKDIAEFSL